MMSPMRAIIRMPPVKTSSASAMVTTRVAMNSSRPVSAPTRSGSALDVRPGQNGLDREAGEDGDQCDRHLAASISAGPEISSPELVSLPVSIR